MPDFDELRRPRALSTARRPPVRRGRRRDGAGDRILRLRVHRRRRRRATASRPRAITCRPSTASGSSGTSSATAPRPGRPVQLPAARRAAGRPGRVAVRAPVLAARGRLRPGRRLEPPAAGDDRRGRPADLRVAACARPPDRSRRARRARVRDRPLPARAERRAPPRLDRRSPPARSLGVERRPAAGSRPRRSRLGRPWPRPPRLDLRSRARVHLALGAVPFALVYARCAAPVAFAWVGAARSPQSVSGSRSARHHQRIGGGGRPLARGGRRVLRRAGSIS